MTKRHGESMWFTCLQHPLDGWHVALNNLRIQEQRVSHRLQSRAQFQLSDLKNIWKYYKPTVSSNSMRVPTMPGQLGQM